MMGSIKMTYTLLGVDLGLAITDSLVLLGLTPKVNAEIFAIEVGIAALIGVYIASYEVKQ